MNLEHTSNQFDLTENIRDILNLLGIEYQDYHNRITFQCPLHDSNKSDSLSILLEGSNKNGLWCCWTQRCETKYGYGLFNLVKGILSVQQNKDISNNEVYKFVKKYAEVSNYNSDLNQYSKLVSTKPKDIKYNIEREKIRNSIQIPAKYFINRGYSPEILNKYDIGTCTTKGKKFFTRIIVPVYDENYNYVGCTSRSPNPECNKCGGYHIGKCPSNNLEKFWSSKWLNSDDFYCGNHLYNIWFAQEQIIKTGTIILVEGPPDIWRLAEAGIYNSIAVFGDKLTEEQQNKLNNLPVFNMVILTDNDKAGKTARSNIELQCKRYYNIIHKQTINKDCGDSSTQELRELLKDFICKK